MDTHEQIAGGGAPARASDRAFGAAFAVVFAVIGAVAWLASTTLSAWLLVISGALLAVALLTPGALSPLNALRVRLMDSVAIPLHHGFCRIFVIIWWNAVLVVGGISLIALFGEAWFRLRAPFTENTIAWNKYLPEVGLMNPSDLEIRYTNKLDYWTVTQTNSLGFPDREPPAPEGAAASCHIAAIGDSFVEAIEVPVEDKFHVRLEEMAAAELPDLDVTTSAYGVRNTGQTHQLPWYDEYARPLRPNLLVLVFVNNDFSNNSPALHAMKTRYGPDGIPYVTAARNADGTMYLVPPNPEIQRRALPPFEDYPLIVRLWLKTSSMSIFSEYLGRKLNIRNTWRIAPIPARVEVLASLPGYESTADGWDPADIQDKDMLEFFVMSAPPPVFREALEITAFALDEFVNRTEIDGAELVVLASHTMGPTGDPLFERLADMARERGIPVINQWDYVARQGGKIEDARFAHDAHWSAQGHQWAAEALLEWLRENPQVCDDADPA